MPLLGLGLLFWAVGTLLVRIAGHHLFDIRRPALTITVYLVSFMAMALFVRWLVPRVILSRADGEGPLPGAPRGKVLRCAQDDTGRRAAAAALLVLPTLVLDPFSVLYAGALFPNLGAAAVPAFADCMLICCAGGLAGAVWRSG